MRPPRLPAGLVAGLLFAFASCAEEPPVDLSPLLGQWTTSDDRYEDRSFTIEDRTLVLGLGTEGISVCRIEEAALEELDADTGRYDLAYVLPNGEEGVFSFEFSKSTGSIRFSNQYDLIWTRGEAPE